MQCTRLSAPKREQDEYLLGRTRSDAIADDRQTWMAPREDRSVLRRLQQSAARQQLVVPLKPAAGEAGDELIDGLHV